LEFFRKDKNFVNRLKRKQKSAHSATSEVVLPKLTAVVDGRRKIKDNPPVIFHYQEKTQDFEKRQHTLRDEYRKSLPPDRRQQRKAWELHARILRTRGDNSSGNAIRDCERSIWQQVQVVPTPLQSWLSGSRRERPCLVEFFFQWRHFPLKCQT
jgi:Uncharacterized protein conserved in bacteria (DUF2252)